MNSDFLREVWQQQPLATVTTEKDNAARRLERIRCEAEEWEREFDQMEKRDIGMPVFMALLSLRGVWTDFYWGEWLLLVSALVLATIALVWRVRRRRLERDYGASLVERFTRMRLVLQQRRAIGVVWVWFALPLGASIGLLVGEIAGGSALASWVGGAVATLAFGWIFFAWWRRERVRIAARLEAVERGLGALAGAPPGPTD